ncbi:unnamed protein product [Mytilus coruscus]|uniref:Uncharacterized protein n=1 Tax=Mytilus coruscus TaxID=42192 RepID=A0A6J8F0L6_MYTCO|nr:unnamed protein product [Mytilus coruscus]
MASCLKEPDSETETARREASKNCPGLYSYLPNWVSRWQRYHVENVLHINYEKNSSELSDVLEKIPKINNLTSQQKYIEILKNTNFGPNIGFKRTACAISKTTKLLDKALEELEANILIIKSSLTSANGSLIYIRMREFITALVGFVNTSYQISKTCAEHAEKEMIPFISEKHTPELYQHLQPCVDFELKELRVNFDYNQEHEQYKEYNINACYCSVFALNGTADNQAVWDNLRGIGELVISKPDFRFYCTGENFKDIHSKLLTVIEVYMTLLEMSYQHYEKLAGAEQLTSEDRATI